MMKAIGIPERCMVMLHMGVASIAVAVIASTGLPMMSGVGPAYQVLFRMILLNTAKKRRGR